MLMRVLVVDDFPPMRITLGRALRGLGFDVSYSENGRDALDKIAAQVRFDVAFVDWNMPEMDGLELVRAIRADPALDPIRIMMVTMESDSTCIAAALEAGANEYLMKPFSQAALREKLALLELAPSLLRATEHRATRGSTPTG
jgi:two-component system chemotaxis response regulator CheY